jgi:hypothetical protein
VKLFIPRLGRQEDLEFLLDTGSTTSLLNPFAQTRLGISGRYFSSQTPTIGRGFGGTHTFYIEPCELFVKDEDIGNQRFSMLMRIARASRTNADLPSVLGIDFLRNFRFTFEAATEYVSLELRQ